MVGSSGALLGDFDDLIGQIVYLFMETFDHVCDFFSFLIWLGYLYIFRLISVVAEKVLVVDILIVKYFLQSLKSFASC